MSEDYDIIIARLERNARIAHDAAGRVRVCGLSQTACELEQFSDLFAQSAVVLRELRLAVVDD